MEYRQMGASGLRVPVLSFGTATFGGGNEFFKAWGNTQQDEANRLVKLCMDHGVSLFDTANVYSRGVSEEILGKALTGIRDKALIATKGSFPMADGPNDYGSSRTHLTKQCEDSLKRLKTDYIDIYYMHGFDANTPIDETLHTLDNLVQSGKVRYIGCSNFSGWHLMKSLGIADRYGWIKYAAHQVAYSLLNREFEWELMPLGIDQNVGTFIWGGLAMGQLTGKFRRNQSAPENNRIAQGGSQGPEVSRELLYNIVDVLDEIAKETGKTVAQVSLNWLLQRPTVTSIVVGARNEEQLKQNFEAVGWNLTKEQVARLDKASEVPKTYPYWHQAKFPMLMPPVV